MTQSSPDSRPDAAAIYGDLTAGDSDLDTVGVCAPGHSSSSTQQASRPILRPGPARGGSTHAVRAGAAGLRSGSSATLGYWTRPW